MAVIKKTSNKCRQECGEKGASALLVGIKIDPYENSMEVPQKNLK